MVQYFLTTLARGTAITMTAIAIIQLAPDGLFPLYPPEMDDHVKALMKETGAYYWRNEDGLTCEQWKQP